MHGCFVTGYALLGPCYRMHALFCYHIWSAYCFFYVLLVLLDCSRSYLDILLVCFLGRCVYELRKKWEVSFFFCFFFLIGGFCISFTWRGLWPLAVYLTTFLEYFLILSNQTGGKIANTWKPRLFFFSTSGVSRWF